jgi:Wzt C-terminal domain
LLAAEERPAERGAGLREWGTGEARITDVQLEDAEGNERRQFLSGQALVVRLRIRVDKPIPAPRVTVEFRDANGSLLGVNETEADVLGWDGTPGVTELAFTCPRLPLADGRFQVSVALSRLDSTLQFHRLDPAIEFNVFPDEDQQGWFRFEGDWALASSPSALEPL